MDHGDFLAGRPGGHRCDHHPDEGPPWGDDPMRWNGAVLTLLGCLGLLLGLVVLSMAGTLMGWWA